VKTQIVYLSPTDDADSARDKLAWVKSSRVLLIWPDRGRVLADRLELVQIQRFAQKRNIQLGLLSFDSEVRQLAQELSIPVFDSLDDLPEERWKDGRFRSIASHEQTYERRLKRASPPGAERAPTWADGFQKTRIRVPASVVLALLFMVVAIVVPSARVVLALPRETQEITFTFQLDHATLEIEGRPTTRPQRRDMAVSGQASRPASGWIEVPAQFASGMVVFTNHSTDPIPIPSGTILQSEDPDGIRLRTSQAVLLSGGEGAKIEVSVEAVRPGTKGNLGAFSISRIEGPLGLLVSVSNLRAMSGGTDTLVSMITEEDHSLLEDDLRAELIVTAFKNFSTLVEGGQLIPDGGVWIAEVFEREYDHGIGDLGNSLGLSMSANAAALVYDRNALKALVVDEIEGLLPVGRRLVEDLTKFEVSVHILASDGEPEQLDLHVEYQTYNKIDLAELRSKIAGRRVGNVKQLLDEFIPDLENAIIEPSPSWIPILPLWRNRIMIDLGWE
jgi:hypothetical protein